MPLPGVARLRLLTDHRLTSRFRQLGIERGSLRLMTDGEDSLRRPLLPTRETMFSDDPARIVVRAFFCATPTGDEELAAALGDDLFATSLRADLLVSAGQRRSVCPFHVRPVRDLFLWSDYVHADAEPDAVMGAGETTSVLYRAAKPYHSIRTTLDLGCGAGTLALLLAACAERVIGTDINERAIALARANALLNEIRNVEFRAGDLYEPVRGEHFDLIVSQPPYYPAGPGIEKTFLHGGMRGDEVAERVVRGAVSQLAPGGRALVFTSWPADRPVVPLEGFCVLELGTDRKEPHGTRQSITVIEHAPSGAGWAARFDVPADCWGYAESPRIDELIAAHDLLFTGDGAIARARLRVVAGAERWHEGDDSYLQCPPESLIGVVPIDNATWSALQAIDSGERHDLTVARLALSRGWLVAEPYSTT